MDVAETTQNTASSPGEAGGWAEWRGKATLNHYGRGSLCFARASFQKGRGYRILSWLLWRHLSSIHTAASAKCQAGFRVSEPLEGFLLDVKESSFIHQRFTVCHPLF